MAQTGINITNTAFVLLCTSLVMLMTPGLALFLWRLDGATKCAGNHNPELHSSLGWTAVLWFAFGYLRCPLGRRSVASSAILRRTRFFAASR